MYSLQLALQIDLGITLPKAFYVKKITSSKEKYICKMITLFLLGLPLPLKTPLLIRSRVHSLTKNGTGTGGV